MKSSSFDFFLNVIWEEQWLTLIVNVAPAMTSMVLAQTLVVFPGGVGSPLQDGDVFQISHSKFSLIDSTLYTVGTCLQETDNKAMIPRTAFICSEHSRHKMQSVHDRLLPCVCSEYEHRTQHGHYIFKFITQKQQVIYLKSSDIIEIHSNSLTSQWLRDLETKSPVWTSAPTVFPGFSISGIITKNKRGFSTYSENTVRCTCSN